ASAAIREWRSAIASAVRNSYSVTDSWVSAFQTQAADAVRQASVAIVSGTDRSAFQLLTNEYNNMQRWSNQMIEARKNLQYTSPSDISNDALFQQLLNCSHALNNIAASGVYQDEASCH